MSADHPPDDDIDLGAAGRSARREHRRRRANRERRVRARHPRIGGALLALRDDPPHERVWARGAVGEERVARSLAKRLGGDVLVMHDRRVPGGRANIDHIAVGPSGVWVIDSKRYTGRVSVATPLFGRRKLTVGGRDRTALVEALAKQVAAIEAVMPEVAPGVPVRGALCFVDADLPLFRDLTYEDHPVLSPRRLARRLNGAGPLAAEQVRELAAALARRFPPA